MAWRTSIVGLFSLCCLARAFYLPGLAPTNFCTQEAKDKHRGSSCKVCACSWLVS